MIVGDREGNAHDFREGQILMVTVQGVALGGDG